MKTTLRKYGTLNMAIVVVTLLSWISVFWIHGLLGTYIWSALKFIVPILGFLGILCNLILIFVRFFQKKPLFKSLLNLTLCTVLASHFLLTMNIIPLAYPIHIQDSHPAITVKWPFAKQTIVGWGGNSTDNNSPHVVWSSERWAYDLVMEPYNIGSTNLADYGVWNQEVLSPVAGTVIAAYDDESDITPGTDEFLSMEGNHVYLRMDTTGTYLLLNHLKKNSVTVSVGDHVNTGDVLGNVGNSGSTSEPHLHIHHQRQNPTTTLHPILAEGLPLFFEDTDADVMPLKGTVVTPEMSTTKRVDE